MSALVLLESRDEQERVVLSAPRVGVFRPRPFALAAPGAPIGSLRVLGRAFTLVCPPGVAGEIEPLAGSAVVAVEYGQALARVVRRESSSIAAGSSATASHGAALSAPIHGIFYRRASPAAPPFVADGATIRPGQTVGLIEVMKTFHPVVYDEANARGPAKLLRFLVAEQSEVAAGQALAELEPLG